MANLSDSVSLGIAPYLVTSNILYFTIGIGSSLYLYPEYEKSGKIGSVLFFDASLNCSQSLLVSWALQLKLKVIRSVK